MAAIAADFSALYNGPFYSETEWRSFAAGLASRYGVVAGLGNELAVTADDTGMHVDVAGGVAHIAGATGAWNTSTEIPLPDADDLHDRIDLIVVRNRYSVSSPTFTQGQMELDVRTGTPDVSPARPSPVVDSTMYEVPLAYVTVGQGVTSIDPANDPVLDFRTFTTERSPCSKSTRTVNQSIPNDTNSIVTLNGARPWGAGITIFNDHHVVVTSGRYRGTGVATFEANSTGIRRVFCTKNWTSGDPGSNGIGESFVTNNATSSGSQTLRNQFTADLVAGDTVELAVYQNSGDTRLLTFGSLELEYVGPSVNRQ